MTDHTFETDDGIPVVVTNDGCTCGIGRGDVYEYELCLDSREDVDSLIEALQQAREHMRTAAEVQTIRDENRLRYEAELAAAPKREPLPPAQVRLIAEDGTVSDAMSDEVFGAGSWQDLLARGICRETDFEPSYEMVVEMKTS